MLWTWRSSNSQRVFVAPSNLPLFLLAHFGYTVQRFASVANYHVVFALPHQTDYKTTTMAAIYTLLPHSPYLIETTDSCVRVVPLLPQ